MIGRFFDVVAVLIARRPFIALGALLLVTVGLALGMSMVGEQADETAFLSEGSEPAAALDAIGVSFPASSGISPTMLAAIAVLPIGLVLIWVLGTMALTGIPYNVITALITALSIGIGVDYTIHIIHRFTEELEHSGDVTQATNITLRTTGSALVGSALTTALGFGVLLFSPLRPFQQFGMVTAITILFALFAAIAVVPPMLVVWAAYHQWRKAQSENVEPGPISAIIVPPSDKAPASATVPASIHGN